MLPRLRESLASDIAEVAALTLLKRENAAEPLHRETIKLVGPEALTGEAIAGIWSRCWAGKSVMGVTICQRSRSGSDPLRGAGWPATCGS
jgi:hypothetical protein